MAEKSCVKRLQKQYRALCKITCWREVKERLLQGKIKFPPEYPYKPPGISSSRKLEPYMVAIKMDTSPYHRRMLPEYVDKYNQQQLIAEQLAVGTRATAKKLKTFKREGWGGPETSRYSKGGYA